LTLAVTRRPSRTSDSGQVPSFNVTAHMVRSRIKSGRSSRTGGLSRFDPDVWQKKKAAFVTAFGHKEF